MFNSRCILTAAVAAAALAVPAAASADSIVYIDGGNVWSAHPDGSGKVQLTDGGDWHSPTQADDGTIAAVEGTGPIRLLARDGRPLHTITTESAPSADGGTFAPRPVNLSLTPDGSKLAYSYVANSCPPGSTCSTIQRSTFYTRTDGTQATPQSEWGNQFGVSDPEWVTNDRALVFGGSGSQVDLDDLGGGDYSFTNWMHPNADQGDGELTRDDTKLATTFFYGDNLEIAFFAVNGDPRTESPPAQPTIACNTTKDPKLADPSWSPDGSSIAFASGEGIKVIHFTKLAADGCETDTDTTLTPTGSEPDWGPADPPAARFSTGTQNGGGGQNGGNGGNGGQNGGGGVLPGRLKVKIAGKSRQSLRRGITVTCAAPAASTCTATATVKAGGKTFRVKASKKMGAGGKGNLTLRFKGASKRKLAAALKRKKSLSATVVIAAKSPAGATGSARKTIHLVR